MELKLTAKERSALEAVHGTRCFDLASRWNGDAFRDHLRQIRREWSGWHIVLFLGRGSPHTAAVSQALADELDIELRWLRLSQPRGCQPSRRRSSDEFASAKNCRRTLRNETSLARLN
jgi:hypothetical protein